MQAGAKVYISSRNAKTCQATADELTKLGPGTCIAIPAVSHRASRFHLKIIDLIVTSRT